MNRFRVFSTKSVLSRKSKGSSVKDIFYYLARMIITPSVQDVIDFAFNWSSMKRGLEVDPHHFRRWYWNLDWQSLLVINVSCQLLLPMTLTSSPGSDTTGTALSNVFFYLLSNPDILARLQKEVDSVFPPGSDIFLSSNATAEMKLLNAVM